MDLFDAYLSYTEETESPRIFHRWCLLSSVGALLGRSVYIQFGHSRIFPNIYCMFIGDPGARKSSAIKLIKKLLQKTGYENFAAEKTTKEKFLLDLEGEEDFTELELDSKITGKGKYDKATEKDLWGDSMEFQEPKEVFIMADEFNDFAGLGNHEFYTTLGNLWDWDDDTTPFRQRVKNTKSVSIFQPTVSILAGNTPENFARAFPSDIIGQGFLSRLLLIHGARTGRRYTIPPTPSEEDTKTIVSLLNEIRNGSIRGEGINIDKEAKELLDNIYTGWIDLPDVRFIHYSNRRLTHLLKLCLVVMAITFKTEIDEAVVIHANTILSAAELLMPKALGEFGKSKNSDITNKIMDILNNATKPVSSKTLYGKVHNDLDNARQLGEILQGLSVAGKIQIVQNKEIASLSGYLPKKEVPLVPKYVDWSLLTDEERMMI